ncbi:MAG: HNH endonuclease [Desulfovibrionales bacterium]|nr:HNH endonuclease [Desulfovibrionales bacterium]
MGKRQNIPAPIRKQCYEEVYYICPLCLGKDNESLALEIHHIDSDKNNNNKDNLIALCRACHAKNIKESELNAINKELRFRDPPIDVFNLILEQPAYRIHDRFAAKGLGEDSHLLQGIKLFEFFLRRLNLNNYQSSEALLKLIQLERRYGEKRLKHAEQHLREAKQLALSRPYLYGRVLYEDGYIRYLKNDLRGGTALLQASEQFSHDKFTRANIRIIQHGMRLNLLRSSFNEKDFFRDANLLQDWDATWYQNALQHLIAKYILENNLDLAEDIIVQYKKINEYKSIKFEENSVPAYFRGRIYLIRDEANKAIDMFLLAINRKIQVCVKEGRSEMRAYLGEAYERIGQEDLALAEYRKGLDEDYFMANQIGHKLCEQRLYNLIEKQFQRKKGKKSNKTV